MDNPLNVVLMQELERYNALLSIIVEHLASLEKGIQGLSVISSDLEVIMQDLLRNKLPVSWAAYYFSMKPLNRWIEDLQDRIEFF
jgi:dynein heavy chain